MPWEDDSSPSSDRDEFLEWVSDQEYRDFLSKQYSDFGFWYAGIAAGSIASTIVALFMAWDWGYNDTRATEIAAILSVVLFIENYYRIILYALEWILRWFGLLGRVVNWMMFYSLKWLPGLQILAGMGLLLMTYYTFTDSGEFYWYVYGVYGLWYWVIWRYRDNVLEYLTILRAEEYEPLIDWSFFNKEDVSDDGYVIINEENWQDYQIASRRRQVQML